MPLYCLVYTSVSSQEMSDDDLKALLKKAREKNKKLNITGMLLHLDPFFIQILEGEETVVLDSFNRIKEDSRH
ncbi:MAG TPA: blue light sensor protein, partial [Methylococcaceae bacterium]|nr:blue light sensor protein [Methylococcaceae bacterium]